MNLTEQELQSAVWLRLKEDYQKRLESLRKQNDRHALTDVETATIRGRIAEVKQFLAIADPKPEINDE